MIGLIAKLKVQPGKAREFEAAFKPLAEIVNSDAEPGALLYQLCKSRTDPNTYVVMEMYKDQAAIEAHRTTPHFTKHFPMVGAFLEPGPPEFEFVDSVE